MAEKSKALRKLRECAGISELERAALLDPNLRAYSAKWRDDRFDAVSRDLFGFTSHEALDFETEDRRFMRLCYGTQADQVAGFAELGWDVTDENGRSLLVLPHFARQLAIAIMVGVGKVPEPTADAWGEALERAAKRFRGSLAPDCSRRV